MPVRTRPSTSPLRRIAVSAVTVVALTGLTACSSPPGGTTSASPGSVGSSGGRQSLDAPSDVATGLNVPWSTAVLPTGDVLVSERESALVKRIGLNGQTREIGRVPDVVAAGEGGLLGIAIDPATYAATPVLYAYLTAADDNRVLSIPLQGDGLGQPTTVLTGIPKASNHNGGRLAFGPDGFLYVTTGDAATTSRAQDLGSLGGKILRVTAQGQPAPGNPFAGSPVWSYGHRNVQGIAWDASGRMWASEFGQNTWDELNVITPG
ncbi:PQQ-dependent sugar dehydrogenase, partial [Lapillicoccus sp.]|uniref:PQQ-dependent sugar dehydrogenase n=1 Tax=Lapillicoccus sp. TaxID=1909287 RepID=UPI003266E353